MAVKARPEPVKGQCVECVRRRNHTGRLVKAKEVEHTPTATITYTVIRCEDCGDKRRLWQ